MERFDFNDVVKDIHQQERDMHDTKGKVYAINEDVLDNFKRIGRVLGLSPYKVLGVYWLKHTDAILNFIKNEGKQPNDTEPIFGRIIDNKAYLNLLYAMALDDSDEELVKQAKEIMG